jgi:hypothetical protein
MAIINFKYNGKIYSFNENNYAQLAAALPRLNNKQFTAREARMLYENRNKNIEIITRNQDGRLEIVYIDTEKDIKKQMNELNRTKNLSLKYNVNIAARLATTFQKGEEITRDNMFKGVRNIISVASIGNTNQQQRTELNLSELETKIEGIFSFKLVIRVSEDIIERTISRIMSFDPANENAYEVQKLLFVQQYIQTIGNNAELIRYGTTYFHPNARFIGDAGNRTIDGKSKMKFSKRNNEYYLRDLKPINIKGIFDVELMEYENPEKKNCLKNFLENHYTNRIFTKCIKKFSEIENPTYDDLKKFVVDNKIKAKFFDINGYCIYEEKGDEKKKMASIRAVIHDNHIYPISKKSKIMNKLEKKIKKIDRENSKIEIVEFKKHHNEKLINIIEQGEMPTIINEKYFIYNDVHHIFNEDYSIIEKIYKIFSIERTPLKATRNNFINDLISIVEKNPVSSYFPYNYKEKGLGFSNFENINEIDIKNIFAIDVNKAFAYALSSLEFLPEIDIRYNKFYIYNGEEIIKHNLYIVETDEPSVFIPDNYSFVWGWYILRIKEIEQIRKDKINYKILEYINAELKLNYYQYIIPRLFNETHNESQNIKDFVKLAINIHIGKFQKIIGEKKLKTHPKKTQFNIMTKEHIMNMEKLGVDSSNLITEEINENYMLTYNTYEDFEVESSNNLPLSYAIIQQARLKIINKLIELDYEAADVIQIKTDAIYLNNKNNKYSCTFDNYLGGWKQLKITEETKEKEFKFYNHLSNSPISFSKPYILNKFNFCSNALAGGGKTHYIINSLTKNISDYVIMASFHKPLITYRVLGLKSNVISHYSFMDKIPDEKNIIIDEMGLLNKNEWDYVLKLLHKYNKNIYLFGDNQQLPPPKDRLINDFFLNSHSLTYSTEWINRRNHFTSDEYKQMITNNNNKEYCLNLIKKYCSSDIDDNETVIIAYRNEKTRKLINEQIMKKNNYIMNKNEISVGVKLINKTNNLTISGCTIYNKHQFIVIENNNKGVIIQDEEKNIFHATHAEIIDNMELAFCLTLYCIQGQSLPKIHFIHSDVDMLCKVPNALYTLISRVKNTTY